MSSNKDYVTTELAILGGKTYKRYPITIWKTNNRRNR